jgi:hypothetical protein
VQNVEDAAIAQRSPSDLTVLAAAPEARGELEVMVGEVFDNGQGGRRPVEQVEDQPDRLLDLFVGIQYDPALEIIDQSRRWPEPELTLRRLLQFAAKKAGTNQV